MTEMCEYIVVMWLMLAVACANCIAAVRDFYIIKPDKIIKLNSF